MRRGVPGRNISNHYFSPQVGKWQILLTHSEIPIKVDTMKASILLIRLAGFLSYTGSLLPSTWRRGVDREGAYTLDWGPGQCLVTLPALSRDKA